MKASPTPESASPVPPAPAAQPDVSATPDAPPLAPAEVSPETAAPGTPHPAATWPEWFAAVDIALAIMVLVGAFLAGSFLARNSDLWLHLAGGRLLAQGKLHPGADPFSYTGADRAWVDTSWLYDVGTYALYSADPTGAALVAVKAVVFAAAFGVLLLIRRPGQSLWPWVGLAAAGVLAAAPYATARPVTVSMLFLALTLLVLFRAEWKPGSWRWPGVLAGLFWVWACTDAWFVLGPLTVALVWLGEWLNPFLTRDEADDRAAAAGASPFPPALPLKSLARATLLGVAAALLNPMFLGAAVRDPGEAFVQLVPAELGLSIPSDAADDPELGRLLLSPFDKEYYERSYRGYSVNGLAAVFVLALGAAALLVGFTRLRAAHIILWVVFGALAVKQVQQIAFFAIVAVPLAAAHLNALSARFTLGPWSHPNTRILLTACSLGRVLSVAAALAMIGVAYPGWLHPQFPLPAYQNRVAWGVEPDGGLTRTAGVLARWRADGGLPDGVRGFHASIDLGNYCAWFAPREKVFVDGRYVFHRADLPDLVAVHRLMASRRGRAEVSPDAVDVWQACEVHKAGYLVVAKQIQSIGSEAFTILRDKNPWVVWHLDGRSAVFARAADAVPADVRRALQFDPVRLAFGPSRDPLPPGGAPPPPPPVREFLDEYLDNPQPTPLDADDADVWALYEMWLGQKRVEEWNVRLGAWHGLAAAVGPAGAVAAFPAQPTAGDAQIALPVVILRAARRAVAAAPNRYEGYMQLIRAYRMQFVPVLDVPAPHLIQLNTTEQALQILTAQVRFLERVPEPEQCNAGLAHLIYREARLAGETYKNTGQIDLARDAFKQAVKYFAYVSPEDARSEIDPRARVDDPKKAIKQMLEEEEDKLTQYIRSRNDQVQQMPSGEQQFRAAMQHSLPGKAIQIFKINEDKGGFTDDWLIKVVLELKAGKLEDAVADLSDIIQKKKSPKSDPRGVNAISAMAMRLEGEYQGAIDAARTSEELLLRVKIPADKANLVRDEKYPLAAEVLKAVVGGAPTLQQMEWENLRSVLEIETVYRYDLGILELVSGNISEAKKQFEKAATPLGIDLARLNTNQAVRVGKYLELIRKSESPAPGR